MLIHQLSNRSDHFDDLSMGKRVGQLPFDGSMALSEDGGDTRKPQCYLSVTGNLRTAVDIMSLFAVIYCTFLAPYDMCFAPEKSFVLIAIDMGIEAFFISEIVLNFFTS
jgi:hypothetical protein